MCSLCISFAHEYQSSLAANTDIIGASYKSHDKNYRYYVCPNHKQGCATKNLRASYLEHLISKTIVNNTLNKQNYKAYNTLLKEVSGTKTNIGLQKELNGVEKAIDNILKVLETHPTEEAKERFDFLCAKKEKIQSKINQTKIIPQITITNLKDVRKTFYRELRKSPDPIIYDILDNIIDKITVSNDGVEIELKI